MVHQTSSACKGAPCTAVRGNLKIGAVDIPQPVRLGGTCDLEAFVPGKERVKVDTVPR
jgi:hypothetical protein